MLRGITERAEAIDAGTASLIGTGTADILRETSLLLGNAEAHEAMARAYNPFGDDKVIKRIVNESRLFFQKRH